ncbi:glycosyltransferase [Hymenobacter sp. HMF4947]|uniref:Glycosyltransferase n=1 Tax=Hymenobacter ginkgonis TaxID=2682976 RepID=A0A7K1TEZ3_9BACT|nr:glycosyltransferase family 2 protein [Hymenobacter ginkgonis]MVN76980.1 glycosyltransferase [Hymenobacter ginkgonis]
MGFSIIITYLLDAIGAFLLLNCIYLLFFALVGHRKLPQLVPTVPIPPRRICVLIPAYKADEVILETAALAIAHQYEGVAHVVVVADGLQPQTLKALRSEGAGVVEVNFERSTKGKALLHALSVLPSNAFDVAVVLDADNIMGQGCLNRINTAFAAGYRVVQAHRTAKNKGTAFALLDACNEEINNHIYRQGPAAIGLSAALIGSGMAFDYGYLRRLLTGIGETVGEDKELDFRIARDQQKIAYLSDMYVYDEKIENAQVFTQQRTRWLASQYEFLKKYAAEGVRQLVRHGNIEFFHKSLQTFLVPRSLLMGILGVFFLLSLVLPFGPSVAFWAGLLVLLAAALGIALPARLYNRQLLAALVRLPYAIWCMCLAMFRINQTKTSFLATPHRAHHPIVPVKN